MPLHRPDALESQMLARPVGRRAHSVSACDSVTRAVLALVLSGGAAVAGMWGGSAMAQSAPTAAQVPPAASGIERALPEFQALRVDGAMKVRVRTGTGQRVSVGGDAERAKEIQTRVDTASGVATLVISGESRWFQWGKKSEAVDIVVEAPALQSVELAGSGDVHLDLQGRQPRLRLSVAGSGDLNTKGADVEALEVQVAGSGDVRVQGRATTVAVAVAGSGDAWLQELIAQDVDVNVAGSGDARVNASRRLSASVSGSGDVRYKGDPPHVRSVVRGSGTVKKF